MAGKLAVLGAKLAENQDLKEFTIKLSTNFSYSKKSWFSSRLWIS